MQHNYNKMILLFNLILILMVKCIIICMLESQVLQFSKKTKFQNGHWLPELLAAIGNMSVLFMVIPTMTLFYLATDGSEFVINDGLFIK